MIQVVYRNGREELVDQKFLDILLYKGEVQEFRRSDHWVNVDEDPVRCSSLDSFSGEERRCHNPVDLLCSF